MTQTTPAEKMTVEQQRGIAQNMGYVNRETYRKAKFAPKHRGPNMKGNNAFHIPGRITFVPAFYPRRKKLKYWQKSIK